jgi:hypothetical protein
MEKSLTYWCKHPNITITRERDTSWGVECDIACPWPRPQLSSTSFYHNLRCHLAFTHFEWIIQKSTPSL